MQSRLSFFPAALRSGTSTLSAQLSTRPCLAPLPESSSPKRGQRIENFVFFFPPRQVVSPRPISFSNMNQPRPAFYLTTAATLATFNSYGTFHSW